MKLVQVDPLPLNNLADRTQPPGGDRTLSFRAGCATFDIFPWLTIEAQQAFVLTARTRRYSDGRRIYSRFEPGNEMFRIVSGSVRKSVLRDDVREALHSLLVPGDCFGICSLFDEAPRHHTTTAIGAVDLQVLGREACDRLRSQHPSFSAGLLRHTSSHTRLLSDYFVSSTPSDG